MRETLAQLLLQWRPGVLAGYWPMRDEPDLRVLLELLHTHGIELALPRVSARDEPLQFRRWQPGEPLESGLFGTCHPAGAAGVRPDLLLIPCLGFDRRCLRLGYGGGYYDRTLEQLPGVRAIGVAYDDCEIVGFDAQPHDLPLDAVVTERRTLLREP